MDTYLYRFMFVRFLFLLSILFFVLLTASLSSLQPLCHDDERSALLQFKDSFILNKSASDNPFGYSKDVASWSLEGGNSDCCSWDGVECNEETGHVIGLELTSSFLYGSITSSNSLFRLRQLERLNLAHNNFNGSQIPFRVGDLLRLTYLNLSYSVFSGQIPSELSHLSKLSSIDLSGNYGLYTLSDLNNLVQNFTTLEDLLLTDINISSPVPKSLENLSSLTTLNLENCELHGEFPTRIFQLPNLRELRIGGNSNLTGHLPEFHSNSFLEVLELDYTSFYGKLPTSIGNLSSLHVLNFGGSRFSGSIPTRIFQLPNLRELRIGGNSNLTGHLPEFHSNSSLEVLVLYETSFYGKLPTSIGNLRFLRVLDFLDNHFSGSIPPSLSNLTQLTYLVMSKNTLTSHIPSSLFANLTQLTLLDLSYNNLSGTLEFDMFPKTKSLSVLLLSSNNFTWQTKANSNDTLPQLDTLRLDSCNLHKFPDFLRNQNKLSVLDLSSNNLQGPIPKWLYNTSIEALHFLILSDNLLIGFEQYQVVLPWPNLESLLLERNMLQGSLPIPQPSIKFYIVQRNLIREMSPLICNLSSLYELDLSYNNLSGKLHPCLGNFSSLFTLQLRRNNFHGTIPKTWAMGSSLKMIDLSENQFQGQLPRSLANCMMLEYLHVGNNQINDTFPFWLGTLSQLKVLIIRSNAFHGAIKIPEINYTFPELHIIDLSHNSISGNLPAEYFLHWIAMKVVGPHNSSYMVGEIHIDGWGDNVDYTVTLANKGRKLDYEKIQDELRVIDFSCNQFEGEIPELVGSLKGLHVLNLSNNALNGHIPSSLGNLAHIESMDLSQNKLLGEIPPQLTQLFFLASFNVSNNCLTGPIPHGSQFDTFQNNSFGGNPGLCGNPLSKKCGDFNYTQNPPSPFENNRSSESPFDFGWKVVVIGYGCGFVIGVVIGQTVIARKYDWFVRTFGKM
ncbi:receptor-like protein 6 [Corylus avellana]|uniref:receptor-like protein 6 n=1 Tax=Corylus avellana TaxID=13451 RepID=UPI00286B6A99|nr:receptor-like protein 6 [Corylus avellana]